jgi:hypothetical protein
MDKHIIMGVHITERVRHAVAVQDVLTKFGCAIRTRLGLHEADGTVCSPNGMILLELLDDDAQVKELQDSLSAIDGVEVKTMVFDHP